MKKEIQTVEQAYQALAQELIDYAANLQWESIGTKTTVIANMTQSSYWRESLGQVIENERLPSMNAAGYASRAVLFLRDDFLRTTGDRIWGLTFTLFPTGKFKIDYDYNKPEGYE
jgi:hypothetical protein